VTAILPMSRTPLILDTTYRARAIPKGSARYWSWLFADSGAREPLLGVYALLAEWNALIDPTTEAAAGRIKLAWWQQEIQRLISGKPTHPIGIYLWTLPRAGAVDLTPLATAFEAVFAESNGAPLENGSDLEPHASALRAAPLIVASRLAAADLDEDSLQRCAHEWAVGDFLARSARDYRREARAGRVPFAVSELLAAGIDNEDLCSDQPPLRLENYLRDLRARARTRYTAACQALPPGRRGQQRHLLILAALGLKHLTLPAAALESPRLQDMLLAWVTARRALKDKD
jgi:15-cis-phytoene synthase